MKLKVTTVIGTRPELIRMAKILSKFDEQFEHRIIHTGQNSGDELRDVFFRDLNIREPDLQFDMRAKNLGTSLACLFEIMGEEFLKHKPDALVILGDTNSALCGILAKRAGIPFYHLEAGLRSFDKNVPEEINRRIIDHTADFNMVYTEHARRNLLNEGLHPRTITLIGSPMREVLEANSKAISESKILEQIGISQKSFYLVSLHRQENVDNIKRLKNILDSIEDLATQTQFPVMFSTHPRTRDRINELGFKTSNKINFHEPFGFNDYCKLQLESKMVLSDSGSISEEASILGFKAITLRDSMERPEALDTGSIVMSGANSTRLVDSVKFIEASPLAANMPDEYKITDTSERVIKFILSTISEYNFWFGIRNN